MRHASCLRDGAVDVVRNSVVFDRDGESYGFVDIDKITQHKVVNKSTKAHRYPKRLDSGEMRTYVELELVCERFQ